MGIITLTKTHRFEPRTLNCNPKHPKTLNSNQKSYIPIRKLTWIPNQNSLPATRNRKFNTKNLDFSQQSPIPHGPCPSRLSGFHVFQVFKSQVFDERRKCAAYPELSTGGAQRRLVVLGTEVRRRWNEERQQSRVSWFPIVFIRAQSGEQRCRDGHKNGGACCQSPYIAGQQEVAGTALGRMWSIALPTSTADAPSLARVFDCGAPNLAPTDVATTP